MASEKCYERAAPYVDYIGRHWKWWFRYNMNKACKAIPVYLQLKKTWLQSQEADGLAIQWHRFILESTSICLVLQYAWYFNINCSFTQCFMTRSQPPEGTKQFFCWFTLDRWNKASQDIQHYLLTFFFFAVYVLLSPCIQWLLFFVGYSKSTYTILFQLIIHLQACSPCPRLKGISKVPTSFMCKWILLSVVKVLL